MKTILAFVGGGDRDQIILQTALAAAEPLKGHLDCLHVHVPAAEAARYNHTEFASGAALRNALERLKTDSNAFADLARENVRGFCAAANVEMSDTPSGLGSVTASFRVETSNALERLVFHARHSDLIVMGRARQKQGLAPDTLGHLMSNAGRPILVAASAAAPTITDTVMVCWNETAAAARAVTAATPLLAKARRLVFVSVAEKDDNIAEALEDLARQFAWNGVSAEAQVVKPNGRRTAAALAATAEELGANLVVMGAYGRSRARELIFGSSTEAFIEHSDRPILLVH